METKFTKGKWRWIYDDPTDSGIKIIGEKEQIVDFVGGSNLSEAEANAKLIVAAPKMFQEHDINKSHCYTVIKMIENNELEPAKNLLKIMADNSEYCIKKAIE